jgi:hypothetical protein
MIISYDEYSETVTSKQIEDGVIGSLSDQMIKVLEEIEILKRQTLNNSNN